MIKLTQSEGRAIIQGAETLFKKELDFPQFKISVLAQAMPMITGVFLVGAMVKLFDLDK